VITPEFRAAGVAKDFSLHGARIALPASLRAPEGQSVAIRIRGVGRVPATAVAQSGDSLRVRFDWRDEAMRERLIVKLFASGAHEVGLRPASVMEILTATWRRAFGMTWLEGYEPRGVADAAMGEGQTPSSPPQPRHAVAG
jgi:hypothetical protein